MKVALREYTSELAGGNMGFTDAEVLEFLIASRAKQGLPAKLTDEERSRIIDGYSSGGFTLAEERDPDMGFMAA